MHISTNLGMPVWGTPFQSPKERCGKQ